MTLDAAEQEVLSRCLANLPPRIAEHTCTSDGSPCSEEVVRNFLLATSIETNDAEFRTPMSIEVLDAGLAALEPMATRRRYPELRSIYERLLLLILRKIREGRSVAERAIRRADVLDCCAMPDDIAEPNYSALYPGQTKLTAKVLHAGFDRAEAKQFRQQLSRAKTRRREIVAMGLRDAVDDLDLALGELQRRERRALSQTPEYSDAVFGPRLLENLGGHLERTASQFLPTVPRADALLCQGLLWEQTQRCWCAWHSLGQSRSLNGDPTATPLTDSVKS
jgi:hypothetical protein